MGNIAILLGSVSAVVGSLFIINIYDPILDQPLTFIVAAIILALSVGQLFYLPKWIADSPKDSNLAAFGVFGAASVLDFIVAISSYFAFKIGESNAAAALNVVWIVLSIFILSLWSVSKNIIDRGDVERGVASAHMKWRNELLSISERIDLGVELKERIADVAEECKYLTKDRGDTVSSYNKIIDQIIYSLKKANDDHAEVLISNLARSFRDREEDLRG